MRLQKLLSAAGVASRRAAETLMLAGRVSVNGQIVQKLGTKVDPERDDVRLDGQRVRPRAEPLYLLVNKPVGYVTTRRDPQGRPTVLSLIRDLPAYVYPVGRLDYDTEGLILLTNDGELAARLTHPRHEVPRIYEARVWGVPSETDLARLSRGIVLGTETRRGDRREGRAAGRARRTAPARVRLLRRLRTPRGDQAVLEIVLHEGRHRQVRRMCQAVGLPVVTLARTGIGPITDRRLKPGRWRPLMPRELRALAGACGLSLVACFLSLVACSW